jgi:hypothetical protein
MQRREKTPAFYLFLFSTMLTLAWPLALFFSAFLLDEPFHGVLDKLIRSGLVLLMLTYPWGLIIASVRILRRPKGTDWRTESNLLLLAAPIMQIAVLSGVLLVVFSLH